MNGLILVGGYSQRMGQDKSSLQYHNKTQRAYLFELLGKFCQEVWISARVEQAQEWQDNLPYLFDNQSNIGPLAGILRAFEYNPDSAWLVVSCDLPYLNDEIIKILIQQRNSEKNATAFQNPSDKLPEPLLSIWEISAHSSLKIAFENGFFSPRKILQNTDCQLISIDKSHFLTNVNTFEEYQAILKKI